MAHSYLRLLHAPMLKDVAETHSKDEPRAHYPPKFYNTETFCLHQNHPSWLSIMPCCVSAGDLTHCYQEQTGNLLNTAGPILNVSMLGT